MKDVTIYTTPTCHFCHTTMDYLKEKNIEYKEIDVKANDVEESSIKEKTNQLGVPVIKVNDTYIVGFNKNALDKALGLMV